MGKFLDELLDLDFMRPEPNRTWPTLKIVVDVMRTLPILFVYGAGMIVLSRTTDLIGQVAFWVLLPILAFVAFCALLQTATLLLILAAGLLSEIPGATAVFTQFRSRFPRAFKFVAVVVAFPLTYLFIALTIRLIATLRVAG